MENAREHLYLAALLHDIGKFYQRADKSLGDKENVLSEVSKRIAAYTCPLNDAGNFAYQHVIWTSEFLEKFDDVFKAITGQDGSPSVKDAENSIYRLACYHHKPDSENSAIVSLADWWSSGIDRYVPIDEEKEDSKDPIQWGEKRYKKIPMYSIFNKINGGNNNYAFPLSPLSIEKDDLFPKAIAKADDGVTEQKYKDLWDKFAEEVPKLPTDSFNGFAESLLYLLKKYTWCVPSNTNGMADVSLFEHLKTTAAFADCLYLYKQAHPDDFAFDKVSKRVSLKDGVCPVILLGGDLSGIQKFIYNLLCI
ncbi:MAG: hypothetical protein LBR34_05775 [Prevotella sp.]|jgi:CRISPR-associated protein Csm1|nr:hypothetical protein [Prevotella sp.]